MYKHRVVVVGYNDDFAQIYSSELQHASLTSR